MVLICNQNIKLAHVLKKNSLCQRLIKEIKLCVKKRKREKNM